jgi:hypothetical protein
VRLDRTGTKPAGEHRFLCGEGDENLELGTVFFFAYEQNVKISAKDSLYYYESKKHKSWLDEGCPE